MERIALTSSLGKLLDWCMSQEATDLHAQADQRYSFRVDGKLRRIPAAQFVAPTNDDIVQMLREAFSSSICARIEKQHEMDLSFLCGRLRYRANFSKQQGAQSFSFRVVPQRIPELDDLGLPSTASELVQEPRGLLLVTGAAGQGKSTTACALLQRLNETIRELHPVSEQANASALLVRSLNAIICQRLVPSTFHKRIPCLEIMKRNAATQDAIARNDLHQLTGIIEASLNEGMHSFDQHLMQLLKNESVTLETAKYYAVNWNRLEMEMHGYASSLPGILKPDRQR